MLDYFRVTGTQFAFGKCCQKTAVQQRKHRLLKYANVIFKVVKVDAQFASDAGIDNRQERCRYEDKIYATLVRRSTKSPHVTQHASAQNKDRKSTRLNSS